METDGATPSWNGRAAEILDGLGVGIGGIVTLYWPSTEGARSAIVVSGAAGHYILGKDEWAHNIAALESIRKGDLS